MTDSESAISKDSWQLAGAQATQAVGAALAHAVLTLRGDEALSHVAPLLVTLSGELGAGKSVLARSVIHALGVAGTVRSPTYTLVETYEPPGCRIAHLDLYRLSGADELHHLGFDDLLRHTDLLLVEWPEQAADALPVPALALRLEFVSEHDRRLIVTRSNGPLLSLIQARLRECTLGFPDS